MPNNPRLEYKPDLKMNDIITVTMQAADWTAFMAWASNVDTDGVNYLIFGQIAEQIMPQLYTTASYKAAESYHEEQANRNPMAEAFQAVGVRLPGTMPTVEDFESVESAHLLMAGATSPSQAVETWTIECAECGVTHDDYERKYNGPLICGHDGMRRVREIKFKMVQDDE